MTKEQLAMKYAEKEFFDIEDEEIVTSTREILVDDTIKDFIAGYDNASKWISVEDRPLFIETKLGWECTEDGDKDFIAAIPYSDSRYPGVEKWWIHHCVVEDEIGLCVVGDDWNEPAGYELKDITHWKPMPEPPKNK